MIRILFILGLLFLTSCGNLLPVLTPPEAGGPPWRVLTSHHVILYTDRDEAGAKETLGDVERTYVALRDIAFSRFLTSTSTRVGSR